MVESIQIVAQANTPSSWIDSPVLSGVGSDDASRLTDILSSQANQEAKVPQTSELSAVSGTQGLAPASASAVSPTSSVKSMGDRILQNMNSVGHDYKERSAEIDKMLSDDNVKLSTKQLLSLQLNITNQSVMIDLFSKGVGKIDQEVDQMTKLQ
jgi:hypothetical protein